MAFWAAFAMNAGSKLAAYGEASANAKAQKAYQQYRNTMTNLSNAVSQNNITVNELFSNDVFKRQALEIQQDYKQSYGDLNVQAGAAGTAGRSVDRALTMVKQNRDMAEQVRNQNLIDSWIGFDVQRQNSAMSAAMQQDHSYIPKPSLSSYLFGAAKDTARESGGWNSVFKELGFNK